MSLAFSEDDSASLDPPSIPPVELEALGGVPELPSDSPISLPDIEVKPSIEATVESELLAIDESEAVTDLAEEEGEKIRERYKDGSIKVERFVTLDDNSNYVNHGDYRMYDQDGKLIAEGKYLMGHRDGVWQRVYHTGEADLFQAYPYNEFQAPFISKAEFAAGSLHGSWSISDAQGRMISEIPLRDGLRHGRAIWNHPNGNLMYEATYRDGMLEGKMAEYSGSGLEIANHKFEAGRRIEREVEHFKGQTVKTEYEFLSKQQSLKTKDNWWEAKPAVYDTAGKRVKHGKFVEWHENGQKKAEGEYEDGNLAGQFASWYENGQRETRGQYQHGQAEGEWTWWHDNGMRRANGRYALGTPDGTWTSWTTEGKLANRQMYSDARGNSSLLRARTVRSSSQQRVPQAQLRRSVR